MTPWLLHDANYSFGRGTYYLDFAGDPTTTPVLTGTRMKSGVKTTVPTDVEEDLDFTKMTAQTWKSNPQRFLHPVGMYPELFERFQSTASEKDDVYEAVKSKEKHRTLSAKRDEAVEMPEDVADVVDDEDDFNEAALAARINPAAEDVVETAQAPEEEDGAE
ncbi:hypothetical protein LTR12_013531 [Friedmanniomyces endolithicus]|nr:hypothetical protein LTR12_013531 [Friedmanniomyces endolithicus]